MLSDYVWVLAFDKNTGERIHFTRCHKNNSKFYAETYALKGYDAKIMTHEEINEMIEQNKK